MIKETKLLPCFGKWDEHDDGCKECMLWIGCIKEKKSLAAEFARKVHIETVGLEDGTMLVDIELPLFEVWGIQI